ncbi:MAG: putative AP-1 complex subunit sigma-2 [Streblomastix strix]|uniref:AP complex subunit sigma n=1 Tax=Streblomastix strix TaxID=222440 RepID=A0A5J4UUV0_9EUKA|nr:MAG: putative AP-1 complex subunit sigma-2 [Streblomastix strix]
MIHYFLLINRAGKCRLQSFYDATKADRALIIREVSNTILSRSSKMCNFFDYRGLKIVYKRYASLFFVAAIDPPDNEFVTLELIQQYVEVLDNYFSSVCELDLVLNFQKTYYILSELLMSGEIMETSKKVILQAVQAQDQAEMEDG